MYYLDILGGLYKKKVKYLVVGDLAVSLYGVPRTTMDIDIIISTEHQNINKILSLLKELGYIPRLPVDPHDLADPEKVKDWVENRNLKAFSFYNKKANYLVIDILLVHPLEFEKAFENKTVKKAGDIEIFLASIDDIIKTKKVSGRSQDRSDIKMLKKVKENLEAGE
jgi:Trk K+ transport system NAD-binding subunit